VLFGLFRKKDRENRPCGSFSKKEPENRPLGTFGCPAMGAEVLEEAEYQPMWDEVKGELSGKKIALFGSYGWGDGEWMRMWEDEAKGAGAELAVDSVIVNGAPDDEGEADCKALGAALA
jgi:flavorubredoxin